MLAFAGLEAAAKTKNGQDGGGGGSAPKSATAALPHSNDLPSACKLALVECGTLHAMTTAFAHWNAALVARMRADALAGRAPSMEPA